MLSDRIFEMLLRANFEVLDENVPEQGVVTETRFIREDWMRKAINKPERLQRLVQRGDLLPVKTRLWTTLISWRTFQGYICNDTPRGKWAYAKALEKVNQAYDFSEVL